MSQSLQHSDESEKACVIFRQAASFLNFFHPGQIPCLLFSVLDHHICLLVVLHENILIKGIDSRNITDVFISAKGKSEHSFFKYTHAIHV